MAADKKEAQPGQMTKTKTNTINPLTPYRLYNAAVATLVFFRYMTDPEASITEYPLDILIHLFEAVAPNSLPGLAIVANGFRAGQAAHGFFHPGDSTIPQALNGLDTLNHIGNLVQRLF